MQVPSYCYWPIGELAASAPILQFEDIVPLETFYDIVSSDIKRESSTCFNYIKQPLNKTDDLWNWLVSANSFLAMVDYPYPANFMMPLPGHPIKEYIFINECGNFIVCSYKRPRRYSLSFLCISNTARLEQHSKQKHDNYEYFCEKCSNCFETKASLTQHIGECRHWDGHRPPPEQKVLWSWRKSIKDARSTNNNAKSPKKGIYEFNRVAVTRSTNNNAKSQSSFNKLHIYPKQLKAELKTIKKQGFVVLEKIYSRCKINQ
ncbi:hypothetical protein Ahy_A05g022041 isoform B [Arachis hypogaea]|uniref:C2H2-type domain-containing protein n=1 Tax=Arachis hypogaea TaxID=3818 RepID=A0A445CZI1_ARAHY|nr:hypothetical protein Ahy_A05g022041 isoform B [Arachis hypogaea]